MHFSSWDGSCASEERGRREWSTVMCLDVNLSSSRLGMVNFDYHLDWIWNQPRDFLLEMYERSNWGEMDTWKRVASLHGLGCQTELKRGGENQPSAFGNVIHEQKQSALIFLKEPELLYDPAIPRLDMYPKNSSSFLRHTCSSMFNIALVTVTRKWKQTRCSSEDE